MKVFAVLLFFLIKAFGENLKAQTKQLQKFPGTPFQGTKEFCDFIKPLKFKVVITGYNVIITKLYKDDKPTVIKGTYKNGKLFTDDPLEKQFHFAGKYYLIYTTNISINNLEGGDYTSYELCANN